MSVDEYAQCELCGYIGPNVYSLVNLEKFVCENCIDDHNVKMLKQKKAEEEK